MVRPRFASRRGTAAKPVALRRPSAGALRRERRLLLKLREERLRDLGGLLLEMYRRGSFREALLSERCADLVAIDTRVGDIETMLSAPRRRTPRCSCGAPLPIGARFCSICGTPVPGTAPPGAAAAGEETIVEPPPRTDGPAEDD